MKEISLSTQLAIALVHELPGQRIGGRVYVCQGEHETIVVDPESGRWSAVPNDMITFVPDPFEGESVWLVRAVG